MSGALRLLLSGVTAATPLLLAAVGETVGEKAGVINVGIEGDMLLGAFAAFAAGRLTHSAAAACLAAALAGLLLAGLFGAVALAGGADQIVTGTATNLLALGATGFLYRTFLAASSSAMAALPAVALGLSAIDLLALGLVPLSFFFLFRTSWGLKLRSTGESLRDSRALALNVRKIQTAAALVGGALAGLAGAVLVLELSDTFLEGMSAGRGFIALALVAFGRWNPLGVGLAALFFGLLQAAQFQLQARGILSLPSQALLLLPYVLSLLALAGLAGRSRSPSDLGKSI